MVISVGFGFGPGHQKFQSRKNFVFSANLFNDTSVKKTTVHLFSSLTVNFCNKCTCTTEKIIFWHFTYASRELMVSVSKKNDFYI